MFVAKDTLNKEKVLRDYEIEDLKDYCKEQGYSDEQTKIFIENSLKSTNLILSE